MRKNKTNVLPFHPSEEALRGLALDKASEEYACLIRCYHILDLARIPFRVKGDAMDQYLMRAFVEGERLGIC